MEIQHTARAIEPGEAVRSYAEQKFRGACGQLEHFGTAHLHVIYDKEGHAKHGEHQIVHAVLTLPHVELNVRESAGDLYAAIDVAADELERQVERYRQKHDSHERARHARSRPE